MIVDYLNTNVASDIDADICIVGAGPAGLSIAHAFANSPLRVCVLESGGLLGEYDSQSLNDAKSIGETKFDATNSRMRAYGGSCNLWGGGCVPLTQLDFASRSWVPESGWPISLEELRPYYWRALEFCGVDVGRLRNENADFSLASEKSAVDGNDLITRLCVHSPLNIGSAYYAEMSRSSNVTVLLHCTLLELLTSECGRRVQSARIGALDGRRGVVKAKQFVLASGGIENARLLLLANSHTGKGIGNDNDLVGRYFMDHPIVKLGVLENGSPDSLAQYRTDIKERRTVLGYQEISLADDSQRRNEILNCRVRPIAVEGLVPKGIAALRKLRSKSEFDGDEKAVVARQITASLRLQDPPSAPLKATNSALQNLRDLGLGVGGVARAVARKMGGRTTVKADHFDLFGFFEQAPNRDSRVTLSQETDVFGLRKIQVDWRLTELDWRTYRSAARLFGEGLTRRFGGRYRPENWLQSANAAIAPSEAPAVRGAAHHIGTTRMSVTPATGVVDVDCLVHGLSNLYVAGSSVFPSGGWAFPTLTIIALSLRVADHIQSQLRFASASPRGTTRVAQLSDSGAGATPTF